jgi:hypothetical protein
VGIVSSSSSSSRKELQFTRSKETTLSSEFDEFFVGGWWSESLTRHHHHHHHHLEKTKMPVQTTHSATMKINMLSSSTTITTTPSTKKRKARRSLSIDRNRDNNNNTKTNNENESDNDNNSNNNDDDDDNKKRGRPRLAKHATDESAADRRRTQIRMAQRAYRQRKESSLDELRQRVSELTNTVELMNRAFAEHHDRLLFRAGGLLSRGGDGGGHMTTMMPTRVMTTMQEVLRETAERFENLMKCVRNPREEKEQQQQHLCVEELPSSSSSSGGGSLLKESPSTGSAHGELAEQQQQQQHPIQAVVVNKNLEPQNVPSWIDRSAVLEQQQRAQPRDPASVGMGYTLYMQETDGSDAAHEYIPTFGATSATALGPVSSSSSPSSSSSKESPHQQSQQQQQQQQNFDIFRLQVPEYAVGIPPSIPPARTYSFQETTFGRRLHRAAVEQGYALLLDPQRRPATYDRVFRLSLMSRTPDKMLRQMKLLLERGPHEPLDVETPLVHIGGAGTHYARREPGGHVTPKKQSWHMGIIGPQTLALMENAARDNISVGMTVDIAGFEGEWLDPYDVEGYLEEKGIFIDPAAAFAEAEVGGRLPPSSSQGSVSGGGSGGGTTESTPPYSAKGSSPPLSAGSFQQPTSPPARPFDREQMYHLNGLGIDASAYCNVLAPSVASSGAFGFYDASSSASESPGSWTNGLPQQPGDTTMRTHMPLEQDIGTPTFDWEGSNSAAKYLPESSAMTMMSEAPEVGGGGGPGKTIIVDVAKFIKSKPPHSVSSTRCRFTHVWCYVLIIIAVVAVLIVSCVCLSRTPGYKRRDVDRALALASFDAF